MVFHTHSHPVFPGAGEAPCQELVVFAEDSCQEPTVGLASTPWSAWHVTYGWSYLPPLGGPQFSYP